MPISHEAIYQALFVQGRGALHRERIAYLRSGRTLRMPRTRIGPHGKSFVSPEIMIGERPAEADDRAVPGHWEGDLILVLGSSATGTLVVSHSCSVCGTQPIFSAMETTAAHRDGWPRS